MTEVLVFYRYEPPVRPIVYWAFYKPAHFPITFSLLHPVVRKWLIIILYPSQIVIVTVFLEKLTTVVFPSVNPLQDQLSAGHRHQMALENHPQHPPATSRPSL